MQNSNYNAMGYRLKLLKNINSSVSFILYILSIIWVIEFVRFCFDLFRYLH